MSKLILIPLFVALLSVIAGFIVLATWDMPVEQQQVEKVLDTEKLLTRAP